MKRITVIGNAGGGKTVFSRKLGKALDLPVYHVDSIQYQPGWTRTPKDECDYQLDALITKDEWVIDGFGSDDVIERRLRAADTVVFVDFPTWAHYWWAFKRQVKSCVAQRAELPANCPEFTFSYSWKLFRVMWEVRRDYTPWFRKLVLPLPDDTKVFHLRMPREWQRFLDIYIQ